MPASYAHSRFAKVLLEKVPQDVADTLSQNRDLFIIGAQGPDILFFYSPLHKNAVSALGEKLHQIPGRTFFQERVKTCLALPKELQKSAVGYLSGVFCHFVLDAVSHAYIFNYTDTDGVPHSEIEGQFDRSLMLADHLNPVRYDIVQDFHPTAENAHVITPFYPEISEEEVQGSIRDFVRFHHVLHCNRALKRNFLYTALKVIGKYDSLSGHIIGAKDNPACVKSSKDLTVLFKEAVEKGIPLLTDFVRGLLQGNVNCLQNSLLERDFEGNTL